MVSTHLVRWFTCAKPNYQKDPEGPKKTNLGTPARRGRRPARCLGLVNSKLWPGVVSRLPPRWMGWMSGRVFYNTLAGDRSRKCVAKIPVVGHRPTHIAMDWGKCLLVYFQIFMVKSPITSHNCWSYIPMTSPHSPQSPNYIPLNLHYPMKFQFSIILSPKRCPYKPIYIW